MIHAASPQKRTSPTVDRILQAAILEFGSNGQEDTKMEDIAFRAGVSKQLIYRYFGTKPALFTESMRIFCEEQNQVLLDMDLDSLSMKEAIGAIFDCMLELSVGAPKCFIPDTMLAKDLGSKTQHAVRACGEAVLKRVEDVLDRGRRSGEIKGEIQAVHVMIHMVLMSSALLNLHAAYRIYIGHDLSDAQSLHEWREYALQTILAALDCSC